MSFWETIVIVIIALIVIRPEQLPELMHTIGKIMFKCRSFYTLLDLQVKQAIKAIEHDTKQKHDTK